MSDVTPFSCPHCEAAYKLVYVEAEESASDPEILWLRCGGPLQAREGDFLRKYLFVDRKRKAALTVVAPNKYRYRPSSLNRGVAEKKNPEPPGSGVASR
jgi:hypothetical protein